MFRILCRWFLTGVVISGCLQAISRPLTQSPYDELAPVISPDGQFLYVTLAFHPQNIGSKQDPGDIWYCKRTSTGWSAPIHAGTTLNHPGFNGVAGFSQDGSRIYLLSHYRGNELPKTQGIAVAEKSLQGWSEPINLTIPDFLNKAAILTGSINLQETTFVFAAEGYFSRGAEDLYITTRKDIHSPWNPPVNLGSGVNTKAQEFSPWLAPDGVTLYFSSNGHPGLGSFDVFQSEMLAGPDQWGPPHPVPQVNSDARETFFQILPNGDALLTTTHNSDGYGDVRTWHFSESTPSNTAIKGFVIGGGDTLTVKVMVKENAHEYVLESGPDGFTLPNPGTFTLRIEVPGFLNYYQTLEIESGTFNCLLEPISKGKIVSLPNVLFEQGRPVLLPESYAELDGVVRFLQLNPAVNIELAGHTDNRGVPRQNLKLSRERVSTVRQYLISKGVSKNRISGRGYGGTKPLSTQDDEESRQKNRRVEFIIR